MVADAHSVCMKERADKAEAYLKLHGYEVTQRNGQRVTMRANHANQPAPKTEGAEVFVGKLPRDLFEDELLPAMLKAGRIYKMRIMMDFSCSNRGFGYVQYMSAEEADNACATLNPLQLRNGHPASGVVPSFDNKRLFFSGLPVIVTEQSLHKELSKVLDGIVNVKIPEPSVENDKRFAFVTFRTHDDATSARRILLPGDVRLFGQSIQVDWAKPVQRPAKKSASPTQCNARRTTGPASASSPSNLSQCSSSSASTSTATSTSPINQTDSLNKLPRTTLDVLSNSILGDRARLMLATDVCGSQTRASHPIVTPNCVLIYNVNPHIASLSKLKKIFQLANQLKVLDIKFVEYAVLAITYTSKEQADLMFETLLLAPNSFAKLALPYHSLTAYREGLTVVDQNANYLVSPSLSSSTSSSSLISSFNQLKCVIPQVTN